LLFKKISVHNENSTYNCVIHFSQYDVKSQNCNLVWYTLKKGSTQSHTALQTFKSCLCFAQNTHNTTLISLFTASVHYFAFPASLDGWSSPWGDLRLRHLFTLFY
jgi:hypothetical protein